MLIWGLIAAKAKVGFVASSSSDSDTVQSSWKRVMKILFVVGIVSVAQLKIDSGSAPAK
jgi:hypothetical protein